MAEKGKNSDHKHISLDDLLKYRDDQLTEREKHAIEKRMLEDDFEREAMEGFENLESSELNKDIASLKKQINERTASKGSNKLYWRMAASLLFLISTSFVIYFLLQTNIQAPEQISQEGAKQRPDSTMIAQDFEVPLEEEVVIPPATKEPIIERKELEKKTRNQGIQMPGAEPENEVAQEFMLDDEPMETEKVEEIIREDIQPVPAQTQIALAEDGRGKIEEWSHVESELSGKATAEDEIKTRKSKSSAKRAAESAKVALAPAVVEPAAEDAGILSENTYTGIVVSEADGEPLPGINVILKGTAIGTITDMDGRFNLEVGQETEPEFVVSGVGYATREIPGAQMKSGEIQLSEDITSLSEIVVVGHGAGKESEPQHEPPKPVGGHNTFKDYIRDNIRYPESIRADEVKATVRMRVLISKEGKIENIKVLKSPDVLFEKEAIRLIEEGPEWEPARENGSPVAEEVIIRIRFNPSEE